MLVVSYVKLPLFFTTIFQQIHALMMFLSKDYIFIVL